MLVQQVVSVVKLAAADAAQHGREVEPGTFLTKDSLGNLEQKPGDVNTVRIVEMESKPKDALADATAIFSRAWAGERKLARIAEALIWANPKDKAQTMRDREKAARKSYLGRRGPSRGR